MQTKRLKLRNGVLAELAEALRFSIMNLANLPSSQLVDTVEKEISTIIKYASEKCNRCISMCSTCQDYYLFGILQNPPFQVCEDCLKLKNAEKHHIRGDYDCCFLYRAIPVLLLDKENANDIIRFYKRMLLHDKKHQEFLLYSMIRYLSFIGDYKQASSALLKYNLTTSLTYDPSAESTHYIQLLRILVSIYESQVTHKTLSIEEYQTFADALEAITTSSQSSFLHALYLFCKFQIDSSSILSTTLSLLQQHPSSSYLHFFTITIIRMIHDGILTSSLPLQPIINEFLPKYIELNPTSQSTVFDLILLFEMGYIDEISISIHLFTLIEFLFSNPPLQLFTMHFLSSLLSKQEIRNHSHIQACIENNKWWLDYLDDSDLRIEYAKEILAIDDEEHEKDDDVANYYFQLLQQYKQTYDYNLLTIWL